MNVRLASLATVVTVAVALVSSASASGPTISASPNPVHRGQTVRLHGAVPGCPAGDQLTLLSKAFAHRHEFAGVPAVYARIATNHTYSVRTTIPAARKAGRYRVTGRCGGGNIGVSLSLRVTN